MARGPMVLVEGLDLAGKTTLASSLRDKWRATGVPVSFSRNALVENNTIAAAANAFYKTYTGTDNVATGGLFLAAHVWDAAHFQAPPPTGAHLQESCWLRTLAYNRFAGTPLIQQLVADAGKEQPAFDLVIFLTADIAVRAARLKQREAEKPGENDALDAMVVTNPAGFLRLEEELRAAVREFNKVVVEIDTTALGKDQVIEAAWAQLKSAGLV